MTEDPSSLFKSRVSLKRCDPARRLDTSPPIRKPGSGNRHPTLTTGINDHCGLNIPTDLYCNSDAQDLILQKRRRDYGS
jgi:hypothetical protein